MNSRENIWTKQEIKILKRFYQDNHYKKGESVSYPQQLLERHSKRGVNSKALKIGLRFLDFSFSENKRLERKGFRHCYRCGKILPLNEKYFEKRYRYHKIVFRYQCRECRKFERQSSELNREQMFRKYKNNAEYRDIEWKLSLEEFKSFWQKPCHYCGSEIRTIGLDRIDNNKGYSTDNVVSCCSVCNKMKNISKEEKFIEHCKKIAKKWE